MPNSYVLSEADRAQLKQLISWWRGGGAGKSSRPTPTRRRNYAGNQAPPELIYGVVHGEIPEAVYEVEPFKITPGESETAVVTILKWDDEKSKLIEDDTYGLLLGRNVASTTPTIGTPEQPVVIVGTLIVAENGDQVFVAAPFDLYSLPGNLFGDSPTGADDPDMAIPYKPGGTRAYQVDSEDCSA